jgi:hypothetical protein
MGAMSEVALKREHRSDDVSATLSAAIDEIDAIDDMPFGKVGKALDRVRALIVKANEAASPSNMEFLTSDQHAAEHWRVG